MGEDSKRGMWIEQDQQIVNNGEQSKDEQYDRSNDTDQGHEDH